ncbi:phage tail protein [Betaproteobacteria bacterium GR16-43]|nr:phage tail protein [Betaproteobacteria bacterium GR16-43]
MSEPFLGEIRMFAGNFPPKNWAFCNGQILPISQNTALFSLLGTNYGGNGTSNFALPNLQASVPIHWGQGPGLSQRVVGETGGSSTVSLLQTEMATHTHSPQASSAAGTLVPPTNAYFATSSSRDKQFANAAPNVTMQANLLDPVGGGQPHNNQFPVTAVSYIIALQGIFPARP